MLVEDSAAIIIGQLDSLEPADEDAVVEVGVESGSSSACTGDLQYAPVPGDCSSFYQGWKFMSFIFIVKSCVNEQAGS